MTTRYLTHKVRRERLCTLHMIDSNPDAYRPIACFPSLTFYCPTFLHNRRRRPRGCVVQTLENRFNLSTLAVRTPASLMYYTLGMRGSTFCVVIYGKSGSAWLK